MSGNDDVAMGDNPDVSLHEDDDPGGIRIGDIYVPPAPKPALTFENTGSRLIIKHIEIENFKSYAGKKILGPFHKNFTAIVGPNGSGKSNVIDSMLFVFGYRAQQIRSKKISVLIHNSEQHPNVRSCTVTVYFQEIIDETQELVPNTEFIVSRTAHKDNSSFYTMNGKRCQFKDVAKALRVKGIDLDHNRFLILQGEVEQIALMKPKGQSENDTGMLEFLEDIIGSSRFKEPIEKLKVRVSELDEQRSEKLNRVKLVEKEKDELEAPKNEALGFLKLENEIVDKKNLGYQQYVLEYEVKMQKTEEKRQKFEENAKEVLEQLKQISEQKTEQENKVKATVDELDGIVKKKEETQEKFKQHDLEDGKLREDMKNVNVRRKKLMQQLNVEKEKFEKIQEVPETNRKKIEECNSLKEKLVNNVETEQANYDEAVKSLKAETLVFQEEKEKEETKLIDLRKVCNEKESAYTLAKNELSLEESKEGKEKCKLEQIENSYSVCQTKIAQNNERRKVVNEDLKQVTSEIVNVEKEVEKLNEAYEAKNTNVRTLRVQYEEVRATHQASSSRGKVHDALMNQKHKGTIPGIYGRLGDLGAIDKKYDVAVSTAGGAALDNLLVDTVDTAKTCIEHLKKHDIGRANFLALEKTYKWQRQADSRETYPENAPRLFDLIKVNNPDLRFAFYHYLRDTLVAEDMKQAERIAFGARRYRVVTLSGEIIETSGVMSGGGREKAHGKMGTQVAAGSDHSKTLKQLEQSLREEEVALRDSLTQKNELETGLTNLKRRLVTLEQDKKKLDLEAPKLKDEKTLLESQIKEQKEVIKRIVPDAKLLEELRGRVEVVEAEYEKSLENSRSIEDKVKQLDRKIKEITSGKVKKVQKQLDESKQQLEKVKKEITRLNVAIKTSERDLKKAEEKISSMEEEIKEAEEKMRGMQTQRRELEEVGKGVIDELAELKKKEEEVGKVLTEERSRLEEVKKEEAKHRSSRIEIDQELDRYNTEIKEHGKSLSHWKREIKKLSFKEIPGEREIPELQTYDRETLEDVDMKQWQYDLNLLEERLAAMKPNLSVINEFKRKEAIYLERVAEFDNITKSREEQRKFHDDLRKARLNEFMEGFSIITAKLKEMYQMITLGGDAELELVDSLDPFTEGIVFSVRPPKKSWKNISNLSGGEKTLSSLALVFALHYYKPTPLYVMDEIDAALDFKNVSIVANYIKERTKNAQFVIISLRSNMFELADRLVGIYKTYNCTKNVAINPQEIAAQNAPAVSSSQTTNRPESVASSKEGRVRTSSAQNATTTTTTEKAASQPSSQNTSAAAPTSMHVLQVS